MFKLTSGVKEVVNNILMLIYELRNSPGTACVHIYIILTRLIA